MKWKQQVVVLVHSILALLKNLEGNKNTAANRSQSITFIGFLISQLKLITNNLNK